MVSERRMRSFQLRGESRGAFNSEENQEELSTPRRIKRSFQLRRIKRSFQL
jgi:hypothetical protein